MLIDYVTQTKHIREIVNGRVLPVHHNVKNSFAFLTAKVPEDSKDLGKLRVTNRFLRCFLDLSIRDWWPRPFLRLDEIEHWCRLLQLLHEKKVRARGGRGFTT